MVVSVLSGSDDNKVPKFDSIVFKIVGEIVKVRCRNAGWNSDGV